MIATTKHLLLLTAASLSALFLHSHLFSSTTTSDECRVHFYEGIVSVGGQHWFTMDKACYRHDGEEVCEGISYKRSSVRGSDPLGGFLQDSVLVDDEWEFWRRTYDKDATTLMFGQTYRKDVGGTAYPADSTLKAAEEGVASWFPSFRVNKEQVHGFMELNGLMAGSRFPRLQPVSKLSPQNAFQQGPITFFNDDCVLIMSPASSFMATSGLYRADKQAYGFGVLGSVTQVPKGHELSVILSSSPREGHDSIRRAFQHWGAKLLQLYNTQRPSDETVKHLQYSTDNGAFYYYQTEPNKNYQETILDVYQQSQSLGLPFKSWLMDSWWYYQGKNKGVTQWTARPEIFPDGIEAVTQATEWMVVAHNRYWASDTVYAKQNGGDYDFVVEESLALPVEQRFWNDLLASSKALWGLTVYEQDWLNQQTAGMDYILTSVHAARDWLLQMGTAAKMHGIPIQYCMSYPRHILQSLEVEYVTQARASADYQPSNDYPQGVWLDNNWNIGLSSLFLEALHIVPMKDNFWSSSLPQNHTYKDHNSEGASRLHAIVSIFSTGAVAPSDALEHLNVTLIMKTCGANGRLLQPDRPAVPTDATIVEAAGSAGEEMRQVWTTQTNLSGFVYTYVLAIQSPSFQLTLADVYNSSTGHVVAWEVDAPLYDYHPELPLTVPDSTVSDAHVYAVAPVFANGYALLGEAETKFVPVSRARFSMLVVSDNGFTVRVHGAPAEKVQLVVQVPGGTIEKMDCEIPESGVAQFTTEDLACH